jgi:pyridoxamine 5'-phosphate oxidase
VSDWLADMRLSYHPGHLDLPDLEETWLGQLQAWLAEALERKLLEPNAMVVATATADAIPSARTVLLKGLDERGLVFFTNLESRKGREVAENPHASAVLTWLELQRQVRVDGAVEPVGADEADAYFASRPRGSKLAALASPQSRVIESRAEMERVWSEMAERYPEGTEVPRPKEWGGLRLVPEVVEFWQGHPDRLHDRLRFRHTVGEWVVERLAP